MATGMKMRPNASAPWQAALRRALEEGVEVRQLAGCGMWITTSLGRRDPRGFAPRGRSQGTRRG